MASVVSVVRLCVIGRTFCFLSFLQFLIKKLKDEIYLWDTSLCFYSLPFLFPLICFSRYLNRGCFPYWRGDVISRAESRLSYTIVTSLPSPEWEQNWQSWFQLSSKIKQKHIYQAVFQAGGKTSEKWLPGLFKEAGFLDLDFPSLHFLIPER